MKTTMWLVALAIGLGVTTAALAGEPTAADRESARALLQEGDKQSAAGNHGAALKSYEAAHALLDLPATGMAVARAKVELGQLVQAREVVLSIAKIPKPEGAEKPANVQARADAARLADELAARIPSVAVEVKAGPEAKPAVSIDDVALPAGSTSEKVNPGRRKVRVTAAGYKDFEQIVEVKERETKKLSVTLEPGEGSAEPLAGTTEPKPGSGETPPGGTNEPKLVEPPADDNSGSGAMSPLVIGGIVVGSVGVAGIAVGAAFGVLTMNDLDDAETDPSLCPSKRCTPAGRETVDEARTKGIVSTVGFAVGGAALATGVVLVVFGVTSGGDQKDTAAVTVAPGPGDIGAAFAMPF